MPRIPIWLVVAALTVVAGVAACGGRQADPVVDTWPIGPVTVCTPDVRCDALIAEARVGLARRDPGHAEIVEVRLHEEGVVVDADGNQILMTRSGSCCRVARFVLADGTVRAIGVGYPGISRTPVAIDEGP